MTEIPLEITLEGTPNPMTLKYVFSQPLKVDGSSYYLSIDEAEKYSPMAKRLLEVETVAAVMISPEFISVTYTDRQTMRDAHEQVINGIKDHLENCADICLPRDDEVAEEGETSTKIRKVIEEQIRPGLARDGGDINFIRFQDGNVYVTMMGACSGCPHAQMTLKNGVLTAIKEAVPEVEDVISL